MRRQRHVFTAIAVPLALAAFTLPGMGVDTVYAQDEGNGGGPVEGGDHHSRSGAWV